VSTEPGAAHIVFFERRIDSVLLGRRQVQMATLHISSATRTNVTTNCVEENLKKANRYCEND
jgi:hypothetical protein